MDQAWSVPEPPTRPGRSQFSTAVRQDVQIRNRARAGEHPHEITRGAQGSVIYAAGEGEHGNFIAASYRRIVADPLRSARLTKVHTAKRQARPTGAEEETRIWRELDTATSSDALLMNIFCYPGVTTRRELLDLLAVRQPARPVFGFAPGVKLKRTLKDRTEVDMQLGSLLVEAKLTEADFQFAPVRLLERYEAFEEVFERDALNITTRGVRSYQLLRGVLAAHQLQASFAVLVDARRPDLREDWLAVIGAVRSCELRTRLRLHTWQEIAGALPEKLRSFLAVKYGIESVKDLG